MAIIAKKTVFYLFLFGITFYAATLYLLSRKQISPNALANPKPDPQLDAKVIENKEVDDMVNRAMQLKNAKKWDEAFDILDKGLLKYPNSDKLSTHKGGWYFDRANYSMAQIWFERAHKLNPQEVAYPLNVALVLNLQHKEYEAMAWYEIAHRIRPENGPLVALVSGLWKFNNWTNYDVYVESILRDTRKEIANFQTGKYVAMNSMLGMHLPFNLEDLLGIARSESRKIKENAKKQLPANFQPKWTYNPATDDRRIRIGFVSYDYRNHAVGLVVQSMFSFFDRSKYEVFAYNVNDGMKDSFANSPVYQKISSTVEHMVQLTNYTLLEAATKVNSDKIDILVDLGVFTAYHRMDVFSLHPAPMQVVWMGLATTTGADFMDYIISDRFVVPPENEKYYSEKLILMPHSYHIFDHKQLYGLKEKFTDRARFGLPPNDFLYCNPQNNMRLGPELFDHWANILKRTNGTSLVLKFFNDISANNIRYEAKKRGIPVGKDNTNDPTSGSRLYWMHGSGEHIQIKGMCDLYLDTHYYNGHSTTGDMLWAGVPMVTYPGDSMASRAAASFCRSLGFPEMIAYSWQEYEDMAVARAVNREETAKLRKKVEDARMTAPLFDTARWVRNFQRAALQMYKLYQEGKPPQQITVVDPE